MAVSFTPLQQSAILRDGKDVVVSAAAGSGKTAVMVQRAIEQILAGTDVSRILMVTFTNAAAAEMKRRIKNRLLEESQKQNSDALRYQAACLNNSDICTVHSFCLRILREYFHVAGIDPIFRILGNVEQEVLRALAMDRALEESYAGGVDGFADMFSALFDEQEQAFRDTAFSIYDFAQSMGDPDAFYAQAVQAYGRDASFYQSLKQELAQDAADRIRGILLEAVERLRLLQDGMAGSEEEALEKLIGQYRALLTQLEGEEGLLSLEFPTLRFPKSVSEEEKAPVKLLVDRAKETYKALWNQPLFCRLPEENAAQARKMQPRVSVLIAFVQRFAQIYRQQKQARGVIDFSDAEQYAVKILSDAATRAEIQDRYDAVFVDEYQDTNDVQEAILQRVAKPGALFCVGDIKQSIYAFRHAEPAIFLRRYQAYAADERGRRVDLNQNFRSTRNVIACCNLVFSACMNRRTAGVEYDDAHRLHYGREEAGPPCEMLLVRCPDTARARQKTLFEAIWIADRIQQLLQEHPHAAYSDIAILLRSVGKRGLLLKKTLIQLGIPVTGAEKEPYLDSVEIRSVLSILRCVDNGMDDLAQLGCMRSFLGNFSIQELSSIRLSMRQGPIYLALEHAAKQDDALGRRVGDYLNTLSCLRRAAERMTVYEFLTLLLEEYDGMAYFASQKNALDKQNNLNMLLSTAQQYDTYGEEGIYGFLQVVQRLLSSKAAQDEAPPQSGEGVRMMSIHKSKGLEFPYVILPLGDMPFNVKDQTGIVLDKELGVGVEYFDDALGAKDHLALRQEMVRRIQKKDIQEELRILYVGMTRAREQLILTGAVTSRDLLRVLLLSPEDASSPMDWWLMGVRHTAAARPLYQAAGLPSGVLEEGSCLKLRLLDPPEERAQQTQSSRDFSAFVLEHATAQGADWVLRRFSQARPPEGMQPVSKVAASSLNDHGEQAKELPRPAFVQAHAFSATDRGSVYHSVLEHLDFRTAKTAQSVASQMDRMVERELLTPDQAALVRVEDLLRFTNSGLCRRLDQSPKVLKEQPFNLYTDVTLGEQTQRVLVQGIIDCAFLEQNAYVVLDYKTDHAKDVPDEVFVRRYYNQLNLYARALAAAGGIPVKQLVVFLLQDGREIEIPQGEIQV